MGKNKHFSNIDVAICKVSGNKYYSLSDLDVADGTKKFLTTIGGLDDEEDLIYLIAAKKIYANTNLMIIENSNEDGTFTYNFYRNRFLLRIISRLFQSQNR